MEDEFSGLLERLGYRIDIKRDMKSGLDIIAHFDGEPSPRPSKEWECVLLKPFFAPDGKTAFSLKRGDFTNSDVKELLENVEKTKTFTEELYKKIAGASIVANYTKTEAQLDDVLARNVHCWDGRRLIFYAAKARSVAELGSKGPLTEEVVEGINKTSYLIQRQTGKNAMLADIVVLIDDHDRDFALGHARVQDILKRIYEKSIKPMVDANRLETQVAFKFHILGIADKTVFEKAYLDYAKKDEHPKVVFSGSPAMFQYGAAPWATLLTPTFWIQSAE